MAAVQLGTQILNGNKALVEKGQLRQKPRSRSVPRTPELRDTSSPFLTRMNVGTERTRNFSQALELATLITRMGYPSRCSSATAALAGRHAPQEGDMK